MERPPSVIVSWLEFPCFTWLACRLDTFNGIEHAFRLLRQQRRLIDNERPRLAYQLRLPFERRWTREARKTLDVEHRRGRARRQDTVREGETATKLGWLDHVWTSWRR